MSKCMCVQCVQDRILKVSEGTLAVYASLDYRYHGAACPECGKGHCSKALYHGDPCAN